jgi:hypothetical protein
MPDAAAFATIDKPALLVAASESPFVQREMTEAMADALPDARTALVGGGHLIDPAATLGGHCASGSASSLIRVTGWHTGSGRLPRGWPGPSC